MPEGPEVRNIACKLNIRLAGANLISSSLNIPQQKIIRVSCCGKLIIFIMEKGYLASSLGMTGSWIFEEGSYTKAVLQTSVGNVYYNDLRGFGKLSYGGEDMLEKRLSRIGFDLLDISLQGGFNPQEWEEILNHASPRKNISIFLLDQKPIAGIGNYLRAEILYRAKISPFRTVRSLNKEEKERLRITAQETIVQAYNSNGLTIKDYVDPQGEKGRFVCFVYGRSKDPLGNPIKKKQLSGRTIHYVEEIQK